MLVRALPLSYRARSNVGSVAKHRQEKGFPPLQEFVVDVIAPDGENLTDSKDANMLKELKLSSTAIRKYIVENSSKEAFTPRGPRGSSVSQQNDNKRGSGGTKP